ncbi:unnamed protein product [Prorocentrum cordatum]|uniref:Apple domain-containing protein n=1 Tax=Prorocentrum cordatum TaxID=2364126 RepID=A0ABN9S9H3_9DINO|nr:unnamed protein product [Polarella glacialis]
MYQAVLFRGPIAQNFNYSDAVLLPKGDLPTNDAAVFKQPSDTRPIALSDTCNKFPTQWCQQRISDEEAYITTRCQPPAQRGHFVPHALSVRWRTHGGRAIGAVGLVTQRSIRLPRDGAVHAAKMVPDHFGGHYKLHIDCLATWRCTQSRVQAAVDKLEGVQMIEDKPHFGTDADEALVLEDCTEVTRQAARLAGTMLLAEVKGKDHMGLMVLRMIGTGHAGTAAASASATARTTAAASTLQPPDDDFGIGRIGDPRRQGLGNGGASGAVGLRPHAAAKRRVVLAEAASAGAPAPRRVPPPPRCARAARARRAMLGGYASSASDEGAEPAAAADTAGSGSEAEAQGGDAAADKDDDGEEDEESEEDEGTGGGVLPSAGTAFAKMGEAELGFKKFAKDKEKQRRFKDHAIRLDRIMAASASSMRKSGWQPGQEAKAALIPGEAAGGPPKKRAAEADDAPAAGGAAPAAKGGGKGEKGKMSVKDKTRLKRAKGQSGEDHSGRMWKPESWMKIRQEFDCAALASASPVDGFVPVGRGTGVACRSEGPDSPDGCDGDEVNRSGCTVFTKVAKIDECKDLCSREEACTGIEYSSEFQRCEVWKLNLGAGASVEGFQCFAYHRPCSAVGESCLLSGCCLDVGSACYQKDEFWAGCRSECVPGESDSSGPDEKPWSCTEVQKPGRSNGTCAAMGENCSGTGCCNNPALGCFEKTSEWAGCRRTCEPGQPDPSGSDDQPWSCKERLSADRPDRDCLMQIVMTVSAGNVSDKLRQPLLNSTARLDDIAAHTQGLGGEALGSGHYENEGAALVQQGAEVSTLRGGTARADTAEGGTDVDMLNRREGDDGGRFLNLSEIFGSVEADAQAYADVRSQKPNQKGIWGRTMSGLMGDPDSIPFLRGNTDDTELDKLKSVGLKLNDKGDLPVFKSALVTNCAVLVGCLMAFSGLRLQYPEVYANNVREPAEDGYGTAPFKPSLSLLGWVAAGWSVTIDQAERTSGLDAAMMIEFLQFSMKALALVGAPQLFVLCPLYRFCGRGQAGVENDILSMVDMNNLEDGHWLFWAYSGIVWYVVAGTQALIFRTMRSFLERRFRWLKELEPPRSSTLLVEAVPEESCSDAELKAYFSRLFPGDSVESAYIVKHTERLQYLMEQLQINSQFWEQVQYARAQQLERARLASGELEGGKLKADPDMEERVDHYAGRVQVVEKHVLAERKRIVEDSAEPLIQTIRDGKTVKCLSSHARAVNTNCGFVTFKTKRDAMIALNMRCTADQEEFFMSIPPDPQDVIYNDLTYTPQRKTLLAVLGHGAIFAIFIGFVPIVTFVSGFTNLRQLERTMPATSEYISHYPLLLSLMEGVLSSLALTLFTACLPTVLMMIIYRCFLMGAHAWAQQRLQIVYFWFQIIFSILVTAVGGSLLGKIKEIVDKPMDTFGLLADHLPGATHFYLNFIVMQWATHGFVMTRYMQLFKYFGFRALLGKRRAVELAEPEDQDYYGIGSRMARWSATVLIGIIFSTLSPAITGLTFINFLLCRICYGYLLVFAETRKPDSGGLFFVNGLRHVQYGVMIYVILLIGVMARHAKSNGPVIMTAPAALYLMYCCYRFRVGFSYEMLPFQDVVSLPKERSKFHTDDDGSRAYTQRELTETIKKQCIKHGASFLKYSETPKATKAVFSREAMTRSKDFLIDMRGLSPNLAFKKSDINSALKKIIKAMTDPKKPAWKMSQSEKDDWIETMTNRTYNLICHAGEAVRDNRTWIIELLGDAPDQGDDADDEVSDELVDPDSATAAPSATDRDSQWEYSWSSELMLGNRVGIGPNNKGVEEVSLPIHIDEGTNLEELVEARWRDGTTHRFRISVAEFTIGKSGSRARSIDAMWTGEHSATHNVLTLQQRTDRMQLLSLYDQGAQILQVSLYKFGGLPMPQPGQVPNDDPTLRKAVDFMLPFCKMWESDKVQDKKELKRLKDEAEKGQQLLQQCPPARRNAMGAKDVLKRPAAAPAALKRPAGAADAPLASGGVSVAADGGGAVQGGVDIAEPAAKKAKAKATPKATAAKSGSMAVAARSPVKLSVSRASRMEMVILDNKIDVTDAEAICGAQASGSGQANTPSGVSHGASGNACPHGSPQLGGKFVGKAFEGVNADDIRSHLHKIDQCRVSEANNDEFERLICSAISSSAPPQPPVTPSKREADLTNAINTGSIPSRSALDSAFRKDHPVGSPQHNEYTKGTTSEKRAFKIIKWAQTQLDEIKKEKMQSEMLSQTTRSKQDMCTFGELVVGYGGWEWPAAVEGAKRTAAKCAKLGGKWCWRDEWSELLLHRRIKHEDEEEFKKAWAEITTSSSQGSMSESSAAHSAAQVAVEMPAGAAPPNVDAPSAVQPSDAGAAAASGAAARKRSGGNPDEKEPKTKTAKTETTLSAASKLKPLHLKAAQGAELLIRQIGESDAYKWARGSELEELTHALEIVRDGKTECINEFLVTKDAKQFAKNYDEGACVSELNKFNSQKDAVKRPESKLKQICAMHKDRLGAMAADEVLPDSSDCGDNDDDPADMFIEFCTELLLARELSATQFCSLMYYVGIAGIDKAAKVGMRPGSHSGNEQRKINDHIGRTQDRDEMYFLSLPCFDNSSLARSVRQLPVFVPHEQLDVGVGPHARTSLREAIDSNELPNSYAQHPVVVRHGSRDDPVRPLCLYLDGVPYSHTDSVIGVWVECFVDGARHLVAALRKKSLCRCGCRGWCSISALTSFLRWSFAAMADKRYPEKRRDGEAWVESDIQRRGRAGTALAMRSCLLFIKGDWAEHAGTIGLPTWSDIARPCYSCNAHGAGMHRVAGACRTGFPHRGNLEHECDDACSRCEIIIPLTPHLRQLILDVGKLRYDKRPAGSHGRALENPIPLLELERDDRLEPCPDLPDVGKFEQLDLSTVKRIALWRQSRETLTRHRNPLFSTDPPAAEWAAGGLLAPEPAAAGPPEEWRAEGGGAASERGEDGSWMSMDRVEELQRGVDSELRQLHRAAHSAEASDEAEFSEHGGGVGGEAELIGGAADVGQPEDEAELTSGAADVGQPEGEAAPVSPELGQDELAGGAAGAGPPAEGETARGAPERGPEARGGGQRARGAASGGGVDGGLSDKKVVFTGTMEVKRVDAERAAEAAGAIVLPDVSAKMDLLVAGQKAGSKLTKAKELGKEVWDEATFKRAAGL